MKEATPVKYYLARYFFLALGAFQGLAATLMFLQFGHSAKARFVAFAFFTLTLIFVSLHLLVAKRVKRVAMSKKKIAVINPNKIKSYPWSEVKSLKHIPFLNMYSLKLKGKKSKIYFLPATNTATVFGFISTHSDFIAKKVR